jgi:hypothetical protein
MTPSSDPTRPDESGRERDLLAAYTRGDPDAVREAAPPEPTDAQWDAARRRLHARLDPARPAPRSWRATLWAGAALVGAAAAAAVAWVLFGTNPPREDPRAPEVAEARPPVPAAAAPYPAPPPHEPSDPLAGMAVLPVASDDDVVFDRVPGGDGWFPVGVHPLAGVLSLATAEEVELDDPDPAWPRRVAPSPGDAPMIFATKPR